MRGLLNITVINLQDCKIQKIVRGYIMGIPEKFHVELLSLHIKSITLQRCGMLIV